MLRSTKRKTDKVHETSHSPQNLQQGTKSAMDPRLWHKVAAVSGVAALGLGTYGAHFFKPKNPSYKEVWHTASVYHLVHTAALLAAPITKYPTVSLIDAKDYTLILPGPMKHFKFTILAYSGDAWPKCYAVAYLEDRTYSRVAPFGGFAFIGAWASLLF